jgi:hypothetical protein
MTCARLVSLAACAAWLLSGSQAGAQGQPDITPPPTAPAPPDTAVPAPLPPAPFPPPSAAPTPFPPAPPTAAPQAPPFQQAAPAYSLPANAEPVPLAEDDLPWHMPPERLRFHLPSASADEEHFVPALRASFFQFVGGDLEEGGFEIDLRLGSETVGGVLGYVALEQWRGAFMGIDLLRYRGVEVISSGGLYGYVLLPDLEFGIMSDFDAIIVPRLGTALTGFRLVTCLGTVGLKIELRGPLIDAWLAVLPNAPKVFQPSAALGGTLDVGLSL